MNAFTPKADVLIKLARAINLTKHVAVALPAELTALLADPEVCEWYDRMVQLEYVPARQQAIESPGPAPFSRPTPITDEQIADAGPPQTFVQDQVNKIFAPQVGYSLTATHPTEGIICTYREAESLSHALKYCREEFPIEENYSAHSVKNTETGEVTEADAIGAMRAAADSLVAAQPASHAPILNLFEEPQRICPEQWAEVYKLGDRTGLALDCDKNEPVVDTGPRGLSLDEED